MTLLLDLMGLLKDALALIWEGVAILFTLLKRALRGSRS